jgi:hypothetical protein
MPPCNPQIYECLEANEFEYTIRLPVKDALSPDIETMLNHLGPSLERARGLV